MKEKLTYAEAEALVQLEIAQELVFSAIDKSIVELCRELEAIAK